MTHRWSAAPTPPEARHRRFADAVLGLAMRLRSALGLGLAIELALLAAWGTPASAHPNGHDPRTFNARPESTRDDTSGAAPESGHWQELRPVAPPEELTPEQREQLEQLQSIGYLGGTVEDSRSGIAFYDPDQAWQGANFYTSGHQPEAVLMDMEGEVLHRWRLDFDAIWPDSTSQRRRGSTWWRRAHLFPNGDLLVIFEGIGIVKIDVHSNLIWESHNNAHHDLEVLPDGDILVLTREPRLIPAVHQTELTLEDFLTLLAPDGREKKRWSALAAFENSPYREYARSGLKQSGDIFHTNTLHVLKGDAADPVPGFPAGAVLTSMNALGVLAVWDVENETLTWARKSPPHGQHDPRILDNGHLLFFDNLRSAAASVIREMDPVTGDTIWEYHGNALQPFYSRTCGAADRLPNGNTLVTESDGGRAFEVTPEGTIVWEFYNPERAGDDGQFIASISELTRVPWESVEAWLP